MLSLFCTWVCEVAQPNINAVQPAAIPLRKIRFLGFIMLSLVVDYWFELEVAVPAVKWLLEICGNVNDLLLVWQ